MATSKIKNEIKTTTFYAKLSEQTWTTSRDGKYFAYLGEVSSAQEIISVSIKDWGFLRAGDVVQPLLNVDKVVLLSNVNTFASTDAYLEVRVAYR